MLYKFNELGGVFVYFFFECCGLIFFEGGLFFIKFLVFAFMTLFKLFGVCKWEETFLNLSLFIDRGVCDFGLDFFLIFVH